VKVGGVPYEYFPKHFACGYRYLFESLLRLKFEQSYFREYKKMRRLCVDGVKYGKALEVVRHEELGNLDDSRECVILEL
jgi:hypothetical protein